MKVKISVLIAMLIMATNQVSATEVSVALSGNQLLLSWPSSASNDFYLQFATNLTPPIVWNNAVDPSTNGTDLVVTDAPVSAGLFYRLQAWEILFDGASTAAFRGYKQMVFPPTNIWSVTTNRELMAVAAVISPTNDLVTRSQYDNFELRWEWKTSTNGNSGVVIRVTEPSGNNSSTQTGPEYQLDDVNSTEGSIPIRSLGSAYGLFTPTNRVFVPVGQWNECRLIIQNNHVEHWLNGARVLEYQINGPGWTQAVANYPNSDTLPGFAQTSPALIALQHHGSQVWFRNIKIRRLSSE